MTHSQPPTTKDEIKEEVTKFLMSHDFHRREITYTSKPLEEELFNLIDQAIQVGMDLVLEKVKLNRVNRKSFDNSDQEKWGVSYICIIDSQVVGYNQACDDLAAKIAEIKGEHE